MKKILFFLITIISLVFIPHLNAQAQTYSFYEAEYIDGIYMNKYDPSSQTTYYQKARFFRQNGTNNHAYCIEPFSYFYDYGTYNSTFDISNLSATQKRNISALAHFGYGYQNHYDAKWYAITQLLIWKEADPNGDYYFTDGLNGQRITPYNNEINEIYNLINNYYQTPSIANNEYSVVLNGALQITDSNDVIKYYKANNPNVTIKENRIILSNFTEGLNEFSFTRNDSFYNKPIIFYQSANSQNLVETGDIENITIKVTVKAKKTSITINKIDANTNSITPSGEANLNGAIFALYNEYMSKIKELTIKDNKAYLENLNYGTYYLQEIKPGNGYTLNPELIKFTISETNPHQNVTIKNIPIKAKVKIYKVYGTDDNFKNEKNISFNIFNSKNELVKTIITDENGYAEIELPFGSYTLEQLTTTEGYEKIEPIKFEIKDNTTLTYKLKNYLIDVPNTATSTNIFQNILLFLINLLC